MELEIASMAVTHKFCKNEVQNEEENQMNSNGLFEKVTVMPLWQFMPISCLKDFVY